MDNGMIDLNDLARCLKKRWFVIFLAALICALALNVYGVRRANRNAQNAENQHLAYSAAAGELPGYYTEDLFRLRSRLSDNAAEFVEAYANIYRSFLKEYQTESEEIATENLEAYMMFLDSYKDVLSVMSGAQREYYELLVATDTDVDPDSHPEIGNFEREFVSVVQPTWFIIGMFIGAAAACVVVILGYTFKRTAQPTKAD